MDQISVTAIFNLNIRDLTRARLIDKRRHLLTLLNGDVLSNILLGTRHSTPLLEKNRLETSQVTFKLMLFFLGNGCSPQLITEWILTSQHWATLKKGEKRARQINFITNNLNSKSNIWFYYDHATWLFLMEYLEAPEMLIYIKTQELCLLRTRITASRIILTIQKFYNIHVR